MDVIVLARYMQVLSDKFLDAFSHDQMINIHHSFLPAFQVSEFKWCEMRRVTYLTDMPISYSPMIGRQTVF